MSAEIYNFECQDINRQAKSLADFKDKVLLIVNTASNCGFTPQYEGLQKMYESYHKQGLEVLGFPCDQFLHQEPGSESEISQFCQTNYGVTFPMFSKIDVNGSDTHPLYSYLKEQAPGLFNSKAIKWNFTKFLVDKDGRVVKRYATRTKPEAIATDISKLLA